MSKKRKRHSAEFKARVALEAVKGLKTSSELAREYQVHPIQISQWKRQLLEELPEVFRNGKVSPKITSQCKPPLISTMWHRPRSIFQE